MAVVADNAAISVVDVLPRQRIHVGDSEMSYIDTGQGNPIVFLPRQSDVVVPLA